MHKGAHELGAETPRRAGKACWEVRSSWGAKSTGCGRCLACAVGCLARRCTSLIVRRTTALRDIPVRIERESGKSSLTSCPNRGITVHLVCFPLKNTNLYVIYKVPSSNLSKPLKRGMNLSPGSDSCLWLLADPFLL